MNLRSLRKLFARSPDTHRSVSFWHWETPPVASQLESQIDSTLVGGIGGILIDSPPSSHAADYLDEAWLSSLMTATTRVRKQHDSVWIYDDLGSTTSPEKRRRLADSSEHSQQYLRCIELDLTTEAIATLRDHAPVALFCSTSDSTFESVTSLDDLDAGLEMKAWCFVQHSDDQHLRYLHAESVRQYLDESYAPIQLKTKRFFGNTLGVILANNAQLHVGEAVLPWDDDFAEVFEQIYGYDLRPHLLDLIFDSPDAPLRRFQYWSLVADLFKEGFAYTLNRWGEEHKVPCVGFFEPAESLCHEMITTGPRMTLYAQQQFPTVSLVPGLPREDRILYLKQVSSTVNQTDSRGAIGIFAQPTRPLSLDDWHATTLWHLAMGVTYFAIDGAYDTRGMVESMRLPHLNPMESAWPYIRKHFDCLTRLAWMDRRGKAACDVLFLLPSGSIRTAYRPPVSGRSSSPQCEYLDAHVQRLSACLLNHQINFDYGDEALLALHAHADHTTICINSQRYTAVLLPPMTTIRSSTYALLQDFAMSGGRLLLAGTVPNLLDGIPSPEVRIFFEEYAHRITNGIDLFDYSNVLEILKHWKCRTVVASTSSGEAPQGLLASRRVWEDAEILRLTHVHTSSQDIDIQFTSCVTGHVEEWDYRTGAMTSIGACSPDEAFQISGSWKALEARTYVFLPEPMTGDSASGAPFNVERVVELDWIGTRMSGNTITLRESQFLSDDWGDLASARSLMLELLESTPEGVVGSLEWNVHVPIDALASTPWTITLFCPEDGSVSYNGVALEEADDTAIPYPGLRTYNLPDELSSSNRIVVEGKWQSSDQIDLPILSGDFLLKDGAFEDASSVVPLGTWSEVGLGSYGGRVTYEAEVQGYERFDTAPIMLELEGLYSPAEVRVNGQVVDHVLWEPHCCDIRPYWTAGPLRIEVEVAGSWYNALHPEELPIKQGLSQAPLIKIYAQK